MYTEIPSANVCYSRERVYSRYLKQHAKLVVKKEEHKSRCMYMYMFYVIVDNVSLKQLGKQLFVGNL
jgi:hypothetical protein